MTAPTPEELAAWLDNVDAHLTREQYVTRRDAIRLLAEVRRLQAELARRIPIQRYQEVVAEIASLQADRDAAPPVGQSAAEFAESYLDVVEGFHEEARLNRLIVSITARDAEVARAAAERERERIGIAIDDVTEIVCSGRSLYVLEGPAGIMRRVKAAIRSRAPAPTEEG